MRGRHALYGALLALVAVSFSVANLVPAAPVAAAEREDLAALVAATPAGGTLQLDPGVYAGGFTIDRPITIVGSPGTVIDGGGEGSVLTVASPDVTITDLEIRASGTSLQHEDSAVHVLGERFTFQRCRIVDSLFGLYLVDSPGSTITDNEISGKDVEFTRRGDGIHVYTSSGTTVERNHVFDGRDVIAFFSDDVVVRDNLMENGRYGLHLMYSDNVLVEGNRFLHASTGLYVMYSVGIVVRDNVMAMAEGPSAYGMATKESDVVDVTGNRFVSNRAGIFMDGSPFTGGVIGNFAGNVFAYNIVGALFQPSVRNNYFASNAFIDNQEQVSATTGGALDGNVWTVDGVGNHWSDYAGFDADGDGIGDVPYRAEGLYNDLTDRYPELTFFAETPAARALDAAARAFPTLRPDPKLIDDGPLVRAPEISPLRNAPPGPSRVALLAMSAILVAVAVTLVTTAIRRPFGAAT